MTILIFLSGEFTIFSFSNMIFPIDWCLFLPCPKGTISIGSNNLGCTSFFSILIFKWILGLSLIAGASYNYLLLTGEFDFVLEWELRKSPNLIFGSSFECDFRLMRMLLRVRLVAPGLIYFIIRYFLMTLSSSTIVDYSSSYDSWEFSLLTRSANSVKIRSSAFINSSY